MKKALILIITILSIVTLSSNAQTETSTVDSLSQNLYKGSNRYSEGGTTYRVIKWEKLQAYFADVKTLESDLSAQIESSQKEITKLKEKNTKQEESYGLLDEKYNYAVKANDAMEFFSLLIPKKQYNFMMWGLVVILSTIAVVVFLMFKRSNQVTIHAKKELNELSEEFDGYRKRTLKREQEVAAGYQREINKLKGIS